MLDHRMMHIEQGEEERLYFIWTDINLVAAIEGLEGVATVSGSFGERHLHRVWLDPRYDASEVLASIEATVYEREASDE